MTDACIRRRGMYLLAALPVLAGAERARARPDLIALPSTQFIARGLSGDGRVVVGMRQGGSGGSVRWTLAGGVESLSGSTTGWAASASFDGSIIAGYESGGGLYRWTAAGGHQYFGLPVGFDQAANPRISADGQVIVGSAMHFATSAATVWRWTPAGGYQFFLGPIANGHSVSATNAAADVLIGNDRVQQFRIQTLYYAAGPWRHVMAGSTALPASTLLAAAYATSADGQTVVGERWGYNSIGHASNHVAVRWVGGAQHTDLGLLPGYPYSIAQAVSADGSVIAGLAKGPQLEAVWIWKESTGMLNLKDVLLGLGVSAAANWTFSEVVAISDDGLKILGYGNQGKSWLADLSPACYPDCNDDGGLTVSDFGCFQTRFVAGDLYADCTGDGQLTVADFGCFQTAFVGGCP